MFKQSNVGIRPGIWGGEGVPSGFREFKSGSDGVPRGFRGGSEGVPRVFRGGSEGVPRGFRGVPR
eukprot:3029335-Alexandrium_andersonii.AAC.1